MLAPMDHPKFQQHGGAHGAEHPPHRPYWKRMHHSLFFWIAVVFILAAMVVFIMTNNLSVVPGQRAQDPVPAVAP